MMTGSPLFSSLWFHLTTCLLYLFYYCPKSCLAEEEQDNTCAWNDQTSFVTCGDDDDGWCCGCTCQTQRTCWPELEGMDANEASEYLQNDLEPDCNLWIVIQGHWNDLVGRCGNVVYLYIDDDDTNIVTNVPVMKCLKQETGYDDSHYYTNHGSDHVPASMIILALAFLALLLVCVHRRKNRPKRNMLEGDGVLKENSNDYVPVE